MTLLADTFTFGAYVGFFFFALAGLCIIAGVAYAVLEGGSGLYPGDRWLWTGAWIGGGLVIGVITLFAMWPLEYEYHHWVEKRGVVTAKSSRFVPAGDKTVQQRFVFTINGQPLGVDDTRAALAKPGDRVSLRCKKEHQFMQPHDADGWACRWASA